MTKTQAENAYFHIFVPNDLDLRLSDLSQICRPLVTHV